MLKWLASLLAVALGAAPLAAQTETALKEYFEGGTVSPKLAMPGTEDGIDIKFGTAIKAGEPVTIIRHQDQVPSEALTPRSVMASLAQYVDFGPLRTTESEPATSVPGATSQPGSSLPQGPGSLHKGMLLQEVDALLGPPVSSSERKDGSLKVVERVYSSLSGRVTAWFVEGVLIRYTMASE